MKNIKFANLLIFLFYTLIFCLLLRNSFSTLDPDLGWHLKMGQDIAISKQVNYENHYNYIFSETDNYWINHEWLSDFLLFQCYSNFGYIFLNIVFALIIVGALFILNKFIIKNVIKKKEFLFFLLPLEIIGVKACMPHFGVRIQELSVLFIILLFIIIYLFEKRSFEKKDKAWLILFFLIPLIYVWTNLHGGFLIGIFLLFFYLGIKLTEKIISQYPNSKIYKLLNSFLSFPKILSFKDLKTFFIFSLIATASSFLTPYGLKLFDFLFQYKNTAYFKLITEWLPQYLYPFLYWQIFYIGLVLTIIIIALINCQKKKILTPWNLSITILFIFLALKSKRHFPLLFVSTLPLISEIIYNDFYDLFQSKKTKTHWLIKTYLILNFLIIIALCALTTHFNNKPFSSFCNRYPCQGTQFLKDNLKPEETRLFNEYAWGGFLINQYPEQKLFIDGRQPQKPFKGHSYLQEFMIFYQNNDQERLKKIDEYKINAFFIAKTLPIKLNWIDKNIFGLKENNFSENNKLLNFLNTNESWEKIYEDEISYIFKQK